MFLVADLVSLNDSKCRIIRIQYLYTKPSFYEIFRCTAQDCHEEIRNPWLNSKFLYSLSH